MVVVVHLLLLVSLIVQLSKNIIEYMQCVCYYPVSSPLKNCKFCNVFEVVNCLLSRLSGLRS